jgi:uncharacterized protein (DUF2141 family)
VHLLSLFPLLGLLGGAPEPEITVGEDQKGDIIVNVRNFRSSDGHILLVMFNREQDFPDKSKNAVFKDKKKASKSGVRFTIPDMDYGEYAITVVHDANDNGDLDTNWFGLPIEGFGTSNNAPANFGPPKYKKAKFRVESPETRQSIKLKYFAPDWRPGR